MEKEILTCECGSNEHHIILTYDKADNEITVAVRLNRLPFLQRVVLGIGYIFGYKSKFGDYDEVILSDEAVKRLQDIIYKKRYNRR